MTDIDTVRLRKLAEAATPGPWRLLDDDGVPAIRGEGAFSWVISDGAIETVDAEYIVAACNALPALLARLEAFEAVDPSYYSAQWDKVMCRGHWFCKPPSHNPGCPWYKT